MARDEASALDAIKRRKYKQHLKTLPAKNYDSNNTSFLPTMTHIAIQDEAPSYMLVALVRYVMTAKDS